MSVWHICWMVLNWVTTGQTRPWATVVFCSSCSCAFGTWCVQHSKQVHFKVFSVGSKVLAHSLVIHFSHYTTFWVNIENFNYLWSKVFKPLIEGFPNLRWRVSRTFDPTIFYFISNTSFLTILDFIILDIDLIVIYASFEILQSEVGFLWSTNLLFNPKMEILWVSLTIV